METQYEMATVYNLSTQEYTKVRRSELAPSMLRTFIDTTAEVVWVELSPLSEKSSR